MYLPNILVVSADTADWSTMCKASESSAGSPKIGTQFLSALAQPVRCPIEPHQLNALNLCGSQFSASPVNNNNKMVTAAISIPPKAGSLSPKYPKKETASYDSGKGTLSGKSASLSSADSIEGLSDHHHSDHSETPSPKAPNPACHISHSLLPTNGMKSNSPARSVGTNFLSTTSPDYSNQSASVSSGALMPTLKRALEAPPITAALTGATSQSPSSKSGGYGDVRQKHLAVASLLERRSTPANDLMESYSSAAINNYLAGGFHSNATTGQSQRFPTGPNSATSLLSVCPNVNFGGQQQLTSSSSFMGQSSSSWPGVIGNIPAGLAGQFDYSNLSGFNPGFGGLTLSGNFAQNRSAPVAPSQPQLIRPSMITSAAATEFAKLSQPADSIANSYGTHNFAGSFLPATPVSVDISTTDRSITPAHMKKTSMARCHNEGSPKRPYCQDETDEQPLNLSKKPTVSGGNSLMRTPTVVG